MAAWVLQANDASPRNAELTLPLLWSFGRVSAFGCQGTRHKDSVTLDCFKDFASEYDLGFTHASFAKRENQRMSSPLGYVFPKTGNVFPS